VVRGLSSEQVEAALVAEFQARKAGSLTLRQDLLRLVRTAQRLSHLSDEYGSLAAYFDTLFERSGRDPKSMAVALASHASSEKLAGLGIPLAAEFLKNIGLDISKPDRHINRAAGSLGLARFRRWPSREGTTPPQPTEPELVAVMAAMESWAAATGLRVAFLDNAVWLLCARSGLHLSNAELAGLAEGNEQNAPPEAPAIREDQPYDRYVTRLWRHLALYKRERLGVEEDGVSARQRRSYPHILPESLRKLNILEPIRREFWKYGEATGLVRQLHRDFHHLNSSQALAFNLFFPFFSPKEMSAAPLLGALGFPAHPVRRWGFEYIADAEEGTRFDFAVELESGERILVEVKLSESGFGSCGNDDQHRKKYERIYLPKLRSRLTEEALEMGAFFRNYQLARNVSYAGKGVTVVFVIPVANRAAFAEAEQYLRTALRPETQASVRLHSLEDLIASLLGADGEPPLRGYLGMLREKYLFEQAE
jgi:hypothetical protein